MPLYNEENQTKRKSLMADSENQRFLEEGLVEVKDRLARSSLFNPESFTKDLTDDDYIKFGRERIKKQTPRTIMGTAKDVAVTVAKGVVGLGEAAVGLADIPTLGRVGKGMEKYIGYDPQKAKEFLGEFYSPAQKRAFREVEKAKGFVGTIKESLKHPSTIGHAAIESFPLMMGGASAARGLLAIGMKSPLLAGAIGEGIVGAGMAAEETRQQTEDGLLTLKQSAISTLSGAGTALFATVGGRVAQKFGIIDPDTFLASGSNVTSKGIIKRIIGGGISEGAFEELPQSMQEQVWLNAALDKPLMEGVGEAGATGLLTGMAMGAGFNVFTGKQRTPEDIKPPIETAADQQAATNIHDIINEGMAEGNIMGEPFTSDTAFEIINTAYTDKIITDEDIDLFKEQYPDLRPGLNDIIGKGVGETISQEIQDAERIRREVEEASIKERAGREAEERIRVRRVKEGRLEAEKRKALKAERKEAIAEPVVEPEKAMAPEKIEPEVKKEIKFTEIEPEFKAELEDKIEPPEVKRELKPLEALGKMGKAMGENYRKKVFSDLGKGVSQHAYGYAEQLAEAVYKRGYKSFEDINKALDSGQKIKDAQLSLNEANKQLNKYLENLSRKEIKPTIKVEAKLKEPKVEKPKVVEKEPWEMSVEEYQEKWHTLGTSLTKPRDPGKAKQRLYKEGEINHKKIIKQAISEGKPVPKEVLAEYPGLAPAKPTTPKPPKPKPPEAAEKEIKVKPIPEIGEVSPKLLEKRKALEGKIESLKSRIDQAEKTAMPGTFVTGRENVPRSRIRKLEAQLDKRIDSAVEYEKLKKELTQIESQIKSQEEAPKRELVKEKVKAKIEEQFDTIKVGDQIDVGGNNLLTVTKKNPKSVLTEHGGKWTADEIIRIMPEVAPKPKKEPKVEVPVEKVPTKPEPGKAWIKGQQKPILSAREITKGKNKGKYEIVLTRGRDAEGNIIPGMKRVVEKKAIITMPEEKVFATKPTKPQDTISRQDLKEIFGKMKNLRTGVNPQGNFYFKAEGKPAVEILEVDHISGFIQVQKGTDKERIPVGSYLRDTIELKTGGKGFTADINTAWHEFHHYLEKNGIVTPNDIKAIDSAIGKANISEEDRATYVGDRLADWKTQTNTRIKRILKKISDFANAVYEFFSRTRTAKGVLRDIEAGKILSEKKAVGVPTEEKVFQTKPKRDYKDWIKLYDEGKAKKAKTKTDRLGKISLDKETKQGATDTQKISDSPSSPEGFNMPSEGKGRQLLDTVQWKMQDRLIHLKKVQDVIEKTTELPDSSNVYQTEELYHYKTTKRINDADSNLFDPLVESIAKSKHDLEDVEVFLRARHAQEANKRLQAINPKVTDNTALSGMSNAEALKIRKQYMGDIAMYDIAKQIDGITKATRQILVEDGLATKEEIKAWENAYRYYIPLKREGKGSELPKKGRGMYVGGKESKMRLTGSEKLKPVNIVANIMAQHESTIIRAEKAKVGRAMLKLAQEHPNKDLWVADAPELKPFLKMRKGEIISKEITDDIALYAAEHEKEYLDKVTGLPISLSEVVYGRDILYKFADNVLVTKIDGIEHTVTFNEENVHANRIVGALKNLGADNSNAAISVLSKVNRVLAMVNTSYNPEFIISNFARDIQTAGYNINDTQARNVKAKVFKDVGKAWLGIRQGVRGKYDTEWAKHYEAFEKSGAQTGWIDYYKNIEAREKTLKKKLATLEKGNWPATKRAFKSVFEFIDNENTAVENAIRLSTYKHMKGLGISDAKAASAAKNLTVNFNRRGDAGQALNALYLFFNANVQGSVRLLYAASKSPTVRKMMLGTVGFAVMLDILNRSLGGEDDDGENKYDKVPVWVKEHNMVVMRPNGDYFKIPLPWGYNTLHVLGQVIGESVDPNYKKDFSAISSAGRLGGAVLASFNPLGSESSLFQIATPTLGDPFIQWAENQNFAGIPLRPEQNPFDVSKPEYQMYFSNARDPSKWVAKQLNDLTGGDVTKPGLVDVSPEVFDLFIDMFTGGAGRFLDNTLRLPMTLTEKDVDVRHIPFVRRMYGEPSEFAARTTFYDNLNDIRYAEKSEKHYQNIRDFDGLKKTRKDNEVELDFIDRSKGVKKSVDALRKQQKQIEKTTFTKTIKTKRIENIEKQIRQIIDRFNKQYFEAKHK